MLKEIVRELQFITFRPLLSPTHPRRPRGSIVGSIKCSQKTFTTNILSTRLTAPGSPRMSPTMCGSKNYPYLPHGRNFSLDPHLSRNSSQASYIYLTFSELRTSPPTPKEFPIPSVGGSVLGYFVELHNAGRSLSCKFCIIIDYHSWVPKGKIMHDTFCHTTIVFYITIKVKII